MKTEHILLWIDPNGPHRIKGSRGELLEFLMEMLACDLHTACREYRLRIIF